MSIHITPEPSDRACTSSALAWAAACVAALGLLLLGAALDDGTDIDAAQATAEQLAWSQGVAHGERIAIDALAPELARCAAQQGVQP